MPRLIPVAPEAGAIGLAELVDHLSAAPFDGRDEDRFAAIGPMLGRLALDRRFLADIAIAELKARCAGQVADNRYGPQVLMLHPGRGEWFIRANIWPAADDSVVTASGTAPFFYHVPHDHNFSFLTVGYLGPGYASDHWEYDDEQVAGCPGEPVALRHVGRETLGPGQVMLYRAHRDVHSQLPPERLSVTINIMESSARQPWLDQYRFDTDRSEIAGLMNPLAAATLLPLVAHLDGDEGDGLLADIAARHPSGRMRFAAIAARASAAPDLDRRIARLAVGTASPDAQVRALCRHRIDLLERHRRWIGQGPSEADETPAERPSRAA